MSSGHYPGCLGQWGNDLGTKAHLCLYSAPCTTPFFEHAPACFNRRIKWCWEHWVWPFPCVWKLGNRQTNDNERRRFFFSVFSLSRLILAEPGVCRYYPLSRQVFPTLATNLETKLKFGLWEILVLFQPCISVALWDV